MAVPDWMRLTPQRVAFYIFWVGSHLGLFLFGWFKQKNDPDLAVLNGLTYSVWSSRGAGLVLAYDCSILLLPVCRNFIRILRATSLNRIIPFDYNIYFHKCTAYSLLFFSLVHTNAHYKNFFSAPPAVQQFDSHRGITTHIIHYETVGGRTGHLLLFIMLLMYTSAKIEVRRAKFELFWYTHHLYFPFYILVFFHGYGCFVQKIPVTTPKTCKPYNTWMWSMGPFFLYFCERVYREIRGSQYTQLSKVVFHPGNTLELQFEKPSFKYKPGQYLFINIPEVSPLQWHPFTISSTPEEGFVSIHIRIVGDWTRDVAKLMGCFSQGIDKSNNKNLPTLRVDGPYGAPAEDLYTYKVACLIGAGIGVTPAASLLKSIWYRYYRKAPMELQKVYFFWVNRDKEAFEWFQSLLATLEESVPRSFLEIHIYLTGKMGVDDIQNIVLNDQEAADPLTELNSRCHYGRPIWDRVFAGIKAAMDPNGTDGLRCGVFYCGPTPLAHTIRASCIRMSAGNVNFELRKEHF
ncbi:hypothetical protein HK102_003004 [Quaeritorhiza haematococci]|nr:hypothetical protein HK102_003004 [Quaeritorhiza haematococci]